ncbi:alpha/beta fold hydrolase [Actinomadura sp. 1N219]|uniref:alpha/beta fold hydrolase n=1 Tax=Actinomadura sp. 1N219 TaxID=3375152 RepID=UPI0037ACEE59
MTIDGRMVATGGFQTHYFEAGEGDPVILVHGGGAGADGLSNWRDCLPYFSARRRTIVIDMVGFGRSGKPDPAGFGYGQPDRIRQLIDFIEALGLERVSLVGNSMGGAMSLGVAMQRPDLVADLVLMGSAGASNELSPALGPILNYDFTFEGMRRVITALTNPSYVPTEEQIDYRYRSSIEPDTRAAYVATMRWVREVGMAYSESEISSVKARTLVVNGKNDLVAPIKHAYRFLELIENSTGFVLPHCGHWAMIEYPELFSQVTLDFLDRRGA